jgi:hypothetical protein
MTGQGMTENEIHDAVDKLRQAVGILEKATAADCRRIHEAAHLEIVCDHDNRRAKLSTAPLDTKRVGGGVLRIPDAAT